MVQLGSYITPLDRRCDLDLRQSRAYIASMGAIADLLPLLPKPATGPLSVPPEPRIARDPQRLHAALETLRRDKSVVIATKRLRAFLRRFQHDHDVQAGPELDDAIKSLFVEEEAAARRHRETAALADEMRIAAQDQTSSTSALVHEMNALIVNRHADYLEALRDLRVAAVARRAELAPPPEGPVLSTPAEVRAFFQKLHTD